jgi:hypothetical protein
MTLGRTALVLTTLLSAVALDASPPATVANGNGPARLLTEHVRGAPGRSVVIGNTVWRAEPTPSWRRNSTGSWRGFARAVVFEQTAADEECWELQQSVVTLAGGGFGVVWVEGAYPARDVRMQWLDPNGSAVLPAGGLLVAGGSADQADAVIAAHPTAGAFVAFTEDNEVFVQSFDGAGSPRWPGRGVAVVDSTPYEVLSTPHVVAGPDGGVFVCFMYSTGGPINDIRCQHVDSTGSRLWDDAGVSVGAGGDADSRVLPRGVADGAGGLLLFWRNQRRAYLEPDRSPMLMEGQHFDSQGSRLWGPTPLVVRTTGLPSVNDYGYWFFQVASDGSGGAVLAFDDSTGGLATGLDVMAQRVSSAGDLLWGDGAVVTDAVGLQQHEQTIGAPDGGAFVAVWEDAGPDHNRLRLFRLAPDGSPAWAPEGLLLSDPAAKALDYSVCGSFDGGSLRLAWTHQRSPGSLEMDVQLAGYSLAGQRRGGTAGISLTPAPDAQFVRGLAFSPVAAGVLVVWDDRRKGSWTDMDVAGATLKDRFWGWRVPFTLAEEPGFTLAEAPGFTLARGPGR